MDNNSDLPEGWAMPPAMAKRLSDALSKKPITPEDNIQAALDEIARDIAMIEPNPVDWGGWVSYLLEQLEGEAERRGKGAAFEQLLKKLSQDIGT